MVSYMELQNQLTNLIKDVNSIILSNVNDNYKTKQHLIDDLDKLFDVWIKKYDLDLEDKEDVVMDEEALNIIKKSLGMKVNKS